MANNTLVLGDGGNASQVLLPLVPLSALPPFDVKSATDAHVLKMAGGDKQRAAAIVDSVTRFASAKLDPHVQRWSSSS